MKQFLNPADLPNWSNFFSQIVTVESKGLKTIYISGQVGVDNQKRLVGDGTLSTQTAKAFENMVTALSSVGATTANVTKLNIFVVNYRYEHAAIIGEEIRRHFPVQKLPACSLVGVQSLAEERFLIEVEAIAVIDGEEKGI